MNSYNKPCHIISVTNQGGSNNTSINLASAFALMNKKTHLWILMLKPMHLRGVVHRRPTTLLQIFFKYYQCKTMRYQNRFFVRHHSIRPILHAEVELMKRDQREFM